MATFSFPVGYTDKRHLPARLGTTLVFPSVVSLAHLDRVLPSVAPKRGEGKVLVVRLAFCGQGYCRQLVAIHDDVPPGKTSIQQPSRSFGQTPDVTVAAQRETICPIVEN